MKKILLLALLISALASVFAQDEGVTVFEGARLIDGTGHGPKEKSVIMVEGDRITAIGTVGKITYPASARVVSLRGNTVMPGIINGHGHLGLVLGAQSSPEAYTRENVEKELVQYEQYGVTSMMSLGLNKDLVYELRDEQRQGQFPGASIFTAGRGIGALNGAPPVAVGADQVYRPQTPEEARAAVRETTAHHADIVKIWVDDMYGKYPKMNPEIYRAAIDEAHRQQIRVAAHVFYLADAKALVSDGVDVLAHSIRDVPVDSELISMMKARGVFYIPTFTVDESAFIFAENPGILEDPLLVAAVDPELLKQFSSPEYKQKIESDPNLPRVKAAFATGMRNLKMLRDAGVRIAFGTDSGANPSRIPGWAEHHELELMVRAGLTPLQAIVAATRGSAGVLGVSDRGTIEPGKRADFLVLDANPLNDIRNTRQIASIWHDGKEIKPRVPASQ